MKDQIKYREGYKYQLAEDYSIITDITGYYVRNQFIHLEENGKLTILSGYAWDGPSGPTIDTKNSMRGSLVHDVLYQLIRSNLLTMVERGKVDLLFKRILLEDGMSNFRASYFYDAVNLFGKEFADPINNKKIIIAPRSTNEKKE